MNQPKIDLNVETLISNDFLKLRTTDKRAFYFRYDKDCIDENKFTYIFYKEKDEVESSSTTWQGFIGLIENILLEHQNDRT